MNSTNARTSASGGPYGSGTSPRRSNTRNPPPDPVTESVAADWQRVARGATPPPEESLGAEPKSPQPKEN